MIKTGQLVVGRGIPVSGVSSGAGAARNDPTIVSVVFFRFDLFSGVGLSVECELPPRQCLCSFFRVIFLNLPM